MMELWLPTSITSKQQQSNVLLTTTLWQSAFLLKALGMHPIALKIYENDPQTLAEVIRLVEMLSAVHQLTATLTPSTVSMMSSHNKCFAFGWTGHFGCHYLDTSVIAVMNLATLPGTAPT